MLLLIEHDGSESLTVDVAHLDAGAWCEIRVLLEQKLQSCGQLVGSDLLDGVADPDLASIGLVDRGRVGHLTRLGQAKETLETGLIVGSGEVSLVDRIRSVVSGTGVALGTDPLLGNGDQGPEIGIELGQGSSVLVVDIVPALKVGGIVALIALGRTQDDVAQVLDRWGLR